MQVGNFALITTLDSVLYNQEQRLFGGGLFSVGKFYCKSPLLLFHGSDRVRFLRAIMSVDFN